MREVREAPLTAHPRRNKAAHTNKEKEEEQRPQFTVHRPRREVCPVPQLQPVTSLPVTSAGSAGPGLHGAGAETAT